MKKPDFKHVRTYVKPKPVERPRRVAYVRRPDKETRVSVGQSIKVGSAHPLAVGMSAKDREQKMIQAGMHDSKKKSIPFDRMTYASEYTGLDYQRPRTDTLYSQRPIFTYKKKATPINTRLNHAGLVKALASAESDLSGVGSAIKKIGKKFDKGILQKVRKEVKNSKVAKVVVGAALVAGAMAIPGVAPAAVSALKSGAAVAKGAGALVAKGASTVAKGALVAGKAVGKGALAVAKSSPVKSIGKGVATSLIAKATGAPSGLADKLGIGVAIGDMALNSDELKNLAEASGKFGEKIGRARKKVAEVAESSGVKEAMETMKPAIEQYAGDLATRSLINQGVDYNDAVAYGNSLAPGLAQDGIDGAMQEIQPKTDWKMVALVAIPTILALAGSGE